MATNPDTAVLQRDAAFSPQEYTPTRRGLKARDTHRLFGALSVLADYEGPIKAALVATGGDGEDHRRIHRALRFLVDGPAIG